MCHIIGSQVQTQFDLGLVTPELDDAKSSLEWHRVGSKAGFFPMAVEPFVQWASSLNATKRYGSAELCAQSVRQCPRYANDPRERS
jgi:hypothetical protein